MVHRLAPIILLLVAVPRIDAEPPPTVRIVLVGDSTVTDDAGWGRGFARRTTGDVTVVNLAKGGRSSRSFIKEGLLQRALDLRPDYLLIQFGHNDQPGKGPDRETEPDTTYRKFMLEYVDRARAAGITPILVTSLSRRHFGPDGRIHSTLVPYVESVKRIAAERKVPLIDLHARSIEVYEALGEAGCKGLEPKAPDGGADATHLNAAGADRMAGLIAEDLREAVPALARHLTPSPPRDPAERQSPQPGRTSP